MKSMNIIMEQKSNLSLLKIFPKCPYNKPILQLIKLALTALGTVGIYFLDLRIAVGYLICSLLFFFLAMPLWHCQYCYYSVKKTGINPENGKTAVELLPVDQWKETYLEKHVTCAKRWGFMFFILWAGPIVLITVSLFLNFSVFALISLIGFIIALTAMILYTKWKVCPTCAIMEACHDAF